MSGRRVSREVYWRRRLLVLAGAIGLVWLAIQAIGLVRGDDRADPAPTPTPTATVAPTPTEVTEGVVPVSLQTSADACDPTNLKITPWVHSGQLVGGPVNVVLLVSTLDGSACTYTPTSENLLAVVDAAKAPVYDSSVCKTAFIPEPVAVPAGWGTTVSVEWTGRGSGSACSAKEGFASPGSYTLKIGTFGGEPGESTFTLGAQPKPAKTTATATATPSATASATTKAD